MKIILRAGGIIRSGPEREMIDDYMRRAQGLARGTGFLGIEEQQVDLRNAKSRERETQMLLKDSPAGAKLIIFDERGKTPTSRQISERFENWRNEAIPQLILTIGGADGFEPSAIPSGATKWAFGPQTWPHKMVRLMAAEQIYRALSILARTPYHRD
ncbi:23S rRNA (pseudouridine(1915)-N(3))-methyltransferase RlmH [Hellea balneolensis]|uniref:23S rRNA (pseudouridine(1915)-N(3))-methyltransferase RlmH n=1 Tax=Hellea balneolensis TaxID=287478 RepID=UPI000412A81E|nr:23S rRNA (pseudouridine(1915)-N(3))-methyltransferase RlmH [Hellea balneolensis]